MKTSRAALFVILLAIMIAPGCLFAQADRGAIKGIAQDTQNAMVPGTQLTLTNEATGVVAKTVSGSSGQYNFLNLSPGTYSLSSSAKGFSTSVQSHIVVGVGSVVALSIILQPGGVEQTVTVTGNGANVETQTSDVGTVITPQEIKDLPVSLTADSRNPLSFVLLAPGVSSSSPGASPDYRLHISGASSYSNEVYLDGIPIVNTNLSGDTSTNHPPIDAISQFKLINNTQTAQYGLSNGIVSFAFASGTNDYHGSLFEFLQNSALNAAGYVTDALGQKKAPLKQNEFGGTFGGPVRIPGLYNGHDKTFFFVDFTEFKYRPSSNNASLTTIPNAYRTGDFSQSLGAQLTVGGQPVFDPAGRPVYNGEIYDPTTSRTIVSPVDGKTYTIRDPFPGNIIPANYPGLSKVSQGIIQDFPVADSSALFNNLFRNQSQKIDEHRLVVKIDEHISDKHSVSGSVFIGGYSNSNNGGINLLDATANTAPTTQIRLTYNYTHSATLVNNLNIGFLRDTGFNGPVQPTSDLGALGIQGLPSFTSESPFPQIEMGTLTNSIGSSAASADAENRFVENDNLTLVRGHHTFTMGGELRRLQRNEAGIPTGTFTFEPTQTALNGTGFAGGQVVSIPTGTGNPVSSFLFGGLNFSRVNYPVASGYRWWQGGLYLQDDWTVSPNLTLNLGVRYDLQIPRQEVHGYASTLDPTLANPAAGGLPGAFTYYGTGPGRNGKSRIGDINYRGFQPRVGFAYSPDAAHKTAFRGGFAITRPVGNDNLENNISGTLYNTGFSTLATVSTPGDAIGSPAYNWDSPYPAGSISGQDLSAGALVGNDNPPYIKPSAGLPPTSLYYSLQVQQEFPGGMVGTIGYVGGHTYHLGLWSKPNQVDPAVAQKYAGAAAQAGLPLNEFLVLPITDPRAGAAGINAPWGGFTQAFGAAATIGQALRPFPQYGSVDNPFNPIGSVSYNGLQTSLQKRFSRGLTFLISYTFSKTLGNVDSNDGSTAGAENAIYAGSFFQNYYDPRSQRSVTSSDIPQVVSLSYTYELPVGPGKPFLSHGGAIGKAVGGWEVSAIQQYQSGRPTHVEFDAFGSANPLYAGDGFEFRPNLVPGQPLKNPAYSSKCSGPVQSTPGRQPCQFYVNPAAFSVPQNGSFGNAPNILGGLRLPAFLNEDLSVSKRTVIHERLNLQFQANFFNAFNRVVFSNGGNAQTFIYNNSPPDLSPASIGNSSTIFGILAAQQNGARRIQGSLRLEF